MDRIIPRLLTGILGLIFLISGLIKATDLPLFMMQMKAYGLISNPILILISSWGMIILQCTLGTALILYFRPKWTLTAAICLWLILLIGTIWAWTTGSTNECGCYGSWLKNTPKQATFENAVFLFISILAWIKAPFKEQSKVVPKIIPIIAIALISLVLPIFYGVSISEIIHPEYGMNKIDLGQVKPKGLETIDFGSGVHLVFLMGTDCPHCLEVLPELEMLSLSPGIPKIVALCTNDQAQREKFIKDYTPSFLIGQIDDDLFWRLLGNGTTPRLLLVKQGRIAKIWDQAVPKAELILGK
jgi:hypothetical protein